MDVRRLNQIGPAGHQGHPLERVIDGDGQMIARRHVLAGENDIAKRRRIRRLPARPVRAVLEPVQRAGQSEGPRKIESQRVIEPGVLPFGTLLRAEPAASPRVGPSRLNMRCTAGARDLVLDLATRTKAWIEDPHRLQSIERAPVVVEMLGLFAHDAIPEEPEPGEILDDGCGILVPAAAPVDVLETEQEVPPGAPRRPPSFERRADVTEMQVARRARRKTGYGRALSHPRSDASVPPCAGRTGTY